MNPLLDANEDRFLLVPVKYPAVFDMAKKLISSFWTVDELDFHQDKEVFDTLPASEKHFIVSILAFFASADGIVIENLTEQFLGECQLAEARYFYSYQSFNEQVHSETYAKLLEVYLHDGVHLLLAQTKESVPVQKKTAFALKHFQCDDPDRNRNFAKRLIAFACVEGINFSASFCGIFWVKMRNYKLDALTTSNEFISRDEGAHRDFAILLYKTFLDGSLTNGDITSIVRESVDVEIQWVEHALPQGLIGMNAELMTQYVKSTADVLLRDLGVPALYNVENPFPWMKSINLEGKTNFFEKRVSEYARPTNEEFRLDVEF